MRAVPNYQIEIRDEETANTGSSTDPQFEFGSPSREIKKKRISKLMIGYVRTFKFFQGRRGNSMVRGIHIPCHRCEGRVLPLCLWYVGSTKIKNKIHPLLAKSGPFKLP
jgi:hypothetical protein